MTFRKLLSSSELQLYGQAKSTEGNGTHELPCELERNVSVSWDNESELRLSCRLGFPFATAVGDLG